MHSDHTANVNSALTFSALSSTTFRNAPGKVLMATAPSKQSDEQNTSSKKPRRSVLRSLSWKRPSKRTKMEDVENEKEPGFDATVGDEVDVGRSFNTTASSSRGMSDEDAEDELFEHGNTASSSKKRKKIGVWKAVKRFFHRKSDKGSKSFTSEYPRNPYGQPQRSVSDPNLAHRTGERPQVAPLEQVETQMETEVSPKKAISHDSLLSELRSKQRKNVSEESQKVHVVIPEHSDVDWQPSPTSTSQQLLPGLNVSHDKIRVAPRHRRAPTRKGAASVRHAECYVEEDDVIARSKSVGARVQCAVLQKEPQLPPNEREIRARQEEIENQRIKKQIEEEQRKPEQEEVERKKQEVEKEEDEGETLTKEEHERESHEQQKCEQEKLEQERLAKQKLVEKEVDREKVEKQRLEQEKLERLKLEQEKLERERLKHEKLEREKFEQEKLEREKLEQENLEKLRLEQEKIAREKIEREEIEKQGLEEEKHKAEEEIVDVEKVHEESSKLNQYHVQQTTDFSDLVESLRPTGDHTETYREETTEDEINETISLQKPETSGDNETPPSGTTVTCADLSINVVEQDVTTAEVNPAKEHSTPATLDMEINNSSDDQRTEDYLQTNNFVVSPLLTIENSSESAIREIREPAEVKVVELVTERSEESRSVSVSEKESVHTQDTNNLVSTGSEAMKLSADESQLNTDVSVKKETTASLSSSPPVTPNSPIRSKRLVIETPEKVYEKPFMEKVRAEEARANERSDDIQHEQAPSIHRLATEEKMSQDDSNIGVAKLTQAFERSSRSHTISYGERRKKPDVFPKPKAASKPQPQTLERNYRFPVSANKPGETESSGKKSPRKPNDDVVVVLDEVPEKIVETKKSVSSSPAKKVVPPKPKLLPKPVPKPKVKISKPNVDTKTAGEGKENIMKTSSTQSVTNGSIKMADTHHSEDTSKDTSSDLPSFWARRNMFSPEQKTSNSTSTPDISEKPKEAPKHTPFIQLKTDNCAVCGSKVYQMEKFKVKDNIVHRSCIKCSVCKRLLSVGNFIMSQNKIYCKPHEPHIAISLTTV